MCVSTRRARPSARLAALSVLFILQTLSACGPTDRWHRGNLHTHSLWSDGDSYPELIVDWYEQHGYAFVALSDHNVLAEGERWIDVTERSGGDAHLAEYVQRFGDPWVERRVSDSVTQVRLRSLAEYRGLFEQPDHFLIIQAEEITDRFESKPIHVNATNIAELIRPRGGSSVAEVIRNNVAAVFEQRERTGQPMVPHLNHPNFGWAVTVEDLIAVEQERFFEVYNGHPLVNNEGDSLRPSTERMWDIVLTERLSQGRDLLFGIAVDDAHNYRDLDSEHSNPGRGWVMVRSTMLHADSLVLAMERGDFYGSSGVTLESVGVRRGRLSVRIEAEEGLTYRTQFVGTRRGYSLPRAVTSVADTAVVLHVYGPDIGEVLAEVEGEKAEYRFVGDEIYVRAKVISSKLKANPYMRGEFEAAWVQPVIPR